MKFNPISGQFDMVVDDHTKLSNIGTLSHATIDSYLDQAVKTTSSPTFANLTDSAMTLGSVLFAGASGVISQDNTNLFWDNTNKKLGVGLHTPLSPLDVMKGTFTAYPQYLDVTEPDAFRSFHYNSTTTSTSRAGMFVVVDNNTSDNTKSNMGFNSFVYKAGAGHNTGAGGYIAGKYGVRTTASATGNVTNAVAVQTEIAPDAAWNGTMTNVKGLHGKAFTAGGGAITNADSIYLDKQTVGGTRNTAINLAGDSTVANIANCGSALVMGAGQDSAIAYDGTDTVLANLVGTGTFNVKMGLTLSAQNIITDTTTGMKIGTGTTQKIGFWNTAPVIQQVTNAYTSDGEGTAYTGIDNLQAGTPYAQLTDLNQLRVAYETLRASYDDLLTKLKATGIVA